MDLEKIRQSPKFRGNVPSGTINFLPNKEKGDIIYATDKDMTYMYNGTEWVAIQSGENQVIDTGMSILELNRNTIMKMPCKEAKEFWEDTNDMLNDFSHNAGTYLMLYGREVDYFTVFKTECGFEDCDYNNFSDAFLDCLSSLGKVYSIDYADETKQAIEVWVKTPAGKTTVLYLFSYDNGIVTVKY